MKITYYIDDNYIQSSETIEIELNGDTFDLPPKAETNEYLLSIGLNIAKLRGHTSAKKYCIKIKDIKL
ncbi:MAG: hypothetical protein J5911_06275 [Clostridia bacterium]|nr:hypothetical protein [Clostridia bacterium]